MYHLLLDFCFLLLFWFDNLKPPLDMLILLPETVILFTYYTCISTCWSFPLPSTWPESIILQITQCIASCLWALWLSNKEKPLAPLCSNLVLFWSVCVFQCLLCHTSARLGCFEAKRSRPWLYCLVAWLYSTHLLTWMSQHLHLALLMFLVDICYNEVTSIINKIIYSLVGQICDSVVS